MKSIEDEIPFEVPEGWEWTRLKSISYTGTGATPLKSHKAYYDNGNVAWITSAATAEPYISKPTSYITELALVETNCTVYQPGTLVIAMYGEGKTRGQISELQISAATNQACAAVSLIDKSTSLRSYIKCFFIHSYEELRSKAKGGQQPNLNQTIIADMLVPIPPSSELYGIMGIVDKALGCINIITAARQMIQNNAEKIKQHILSLAIRGQLVPQNLGDEPASELLDRIRAEKEVLIQQGKIKRDKRESIIFRSDDNSYYEKIGDEVSCIDDELPYDIPEGWAWCELQQCCVKEIKRGRSPKYAEKGQVLSFAQKCNQKNGGINIRLALWIDDATIGRYNEDEYMRDGDIIINSTGTGTLGRVGVYHSSDNPSAIPIVPDSHVTVVRASGYVHPSYLYFCLKAMQSSIEK